MKAGGTAGMFGTPACPAQWGPSISPRPVTGPPLVGRTAIAATAALTAAGLLSTLHVTGRIVIFWQAAASCEHRWPRLGTQRRLPRPVSPPSDRHKYRTLLPTALAYMGAVTPTARVDGQAGRRRMS